MERDRIRQQLEMVIVARPSSAPGNARTIQCSVVEWMDGRWRIDAPCCGPIFGDKFEGGRDAVSRILRMLDGD